MKPLPQPSAPQPTEHSLRIPARGWRFRLIAVGYGGILLLWSSLEDNSVLPVSLLGAGLSLVIMWGWVTGRYSGAVWHGRRALIAALVSGAAAGAGASLSTAALMLIKDGLHSHLFPDYPFGMMIDILARAPLWGLAGALLAVGLVLAWWGVTSPPADLRSASPSPPRREGE